jgi:hypothetical protein
MFVIALAVFVPEGIPQHIKKGPQDGRRIEPGFFDFHLGENQAVAVG